MTDWKTLLDFKSVPDGELPPSYADLVLTFTETVEKNPDLWWELPKWIALPTDRDRFTVIARNGLDPLSVLARHTPSGIFVKYAQMECS